MTRNPEDADTPRRLRAYHRVVLEFALEALDDTDLQALLQRATECVSRGIGVERVKILRRRRPESDLLIVAGVGWKPGVVGHATLPLGLRSPPGRAVETRAAVRIDNLPAADDYDYSQLLRDHGIQSLINVPIEANGGVWGVLEVDSTGLRRFSDDDEAFLCGFARVIGRTIELKRRAERSAATQRDLRIEVSERAVLFAELRHRIANQLHMAMGTLEVARRRVVDPLAKVELERVIDRVASMVATNEQLSLSQVESEISLGAYFARLSESIDPPDGIEIRHTLAEATVPLRVAVRLGFIVNELVVNAIKHAFDGPNGSIHIAFSVADGSGVLSVGDNGRGIQHGREGSSGAGLVKSLASQIDGSVQVTTGPTGTAVSVRFPLRPRDGAAT